MGILLGPCVATTLAGTGGRLRKTRNVPGERCSPNLPRRDRAEPFSRRVGSRLCFSYHADIGGSVSSISSSAPGALFDAFAPASHGCGRADFERRLELHA